MGKKKARKWGRWRPHKGVVIEGGQARIYQVEDSTGEIEGLFGLKELKNPKRAGRFERELEAMLMLPPHPNIVTLVDKDIFRDNAKPCYVMPWADGTLRDALTQLRGNYDHLLDLFDQICEGVRHLHSAGVKHRDLKPDNILMYGGVPKISDLGLCLLESSDRITDTNEAVRPRKYGAPELADGRLSDVLPSVDVYSLGKILYFLLTGGKEFERENHRQRKSQLEVLTGDPRLTIFESLLNKSITESSHERYPNAMSFHAAFLEARKRFDSHPRSILLRRFGSMEVALAAKSDELVSVSVAELTELLEYALTLSKNALPQPQILDAASLRLASRSIINALSSCLVLWRPMLDGGVAVRVARRTLLTVNSDPLLGLTMRADAEACVLELAADDTSEVLEAMASWNKPGLLRSQASLALVATNFTRLSAESRKCFVISTYGVSYPGKERALITLLKDDERDVLETEAAVAGLCNCATATALNVVAELADSDLFDPERGAVVRGIALGANPQAINSLRSRSWVNPLIPKLLDVASQAASDSDRLAD
jgi:serine/threonine protein kinase